MQKYLPVILIAVLVISLTSTAFCQTENQQTEIEATVNSFYNSVEKYDMETFFNVLTPQVAENLKNGNRDDDEVYDVGNLIRMGAEDPEEMPRFSFVNRKITVNERTENTATVTFDATVNIDEHNPEEKAAMQTSDILKLSLVDGRWLISSLITGRPTE
jgi:hypothetical protein